MGQHQDIPKNIKQVAHIFKLSIIQEKHILPFYSKGLFKSMK